MGIVALGVVCACNKISLERFLLTGVRRTDYMPVFYQGCKDASPISSGVMTLGFASLAPSALIAGVLVKRTQRYRPQMWFGWGLILIGMGLHSTLRAQDSVARAIGFGVIVGVGIG